jgi:hypothetical protein
MSSRVISQLIRVSSCLLEYSILVRFTRGGKYLEISLIPLIEIFATNLLFCLADLICWGFLDAFQLYV